MGALLNKLCPCVRGDDSIEGKTAFVDRYQGETNCFGQKHGYGTYMFKNGDLYEGCWKYNKMHGFGVYTYGTGGRRDGFFRHGKFVGDGKDILSQSSSDGNQPEPFPQTVKDEQLQAERNQRQMQREKRKIEFEKGREDRRKRREEFKAKYGNSRYTDKIMYGATKPRKC